MMFKIYGYVEVMVEANCANEAWSFFEETGMDEVVQQLDCVEEE